MNGLDDWHRNVTLLYHFHNISAFASRSIGHIQWNGDNLPINYYYFLGWSTRPPSSIKHFHRANYLDPKWRQWMMLVTHKLTAQTSVYPRWCEGTIYVRAQLCKSGQRSRNNSEQVIHPDFTLLLAQCDWRRCRRLIPNNFAHIFVGPSPSLSVFLEERWMCTFRLF